MPLYVYSSDNVHTYSAYLLYIHLVCTYLYCRANVYSVWYEYSYMHAQVWQCRLSQYGIVFANRDLAHTCAL